MRVPRPDIYTKDVAQRELATKRERRCAPGLGELPTVLFVHPEVYLSESLVIDCDGTRQYSYLFDTRIHFLSLKA